MVPLWQYGIPTYFPQRTYARSRSKQIEITGNQGRIIASTAKEIIAQRGKVIFRIEMLDKPEKDSEKSFLGKLVFIDHLFNYIKCLKECLFFFQ